MLDKRGFLERPQELSDVIIELGSGETRRYAGSIAVDRCDTPAVDIVGEALEVLRAMPPGCARLVTSSHFLEHVPDPAAMLDAMSRVLRVGGQIEAIVPHFSNPYYFSDPTHTVVPGFGLYTMSYYARPGDVLRRKNIPGYVRREHLTLECVDLRFKSTIPFYGRHALKRLIGTLFNSCRYMQELWEENFCYLFPCYEIRYVLTKTADVGSHPE
ncbi:MAG TPA: methyltransferase domain-containing protein [Thermoanaerobaculia bacterium]|nr:methyltransferase domain-containing protein [Thermoanaerobaculia bacterium]